MKLSTVVLVLFLLGFVHHAEGINITNTLNTIEGDVNTTLTSVKSALPSLADIENGMQIVGEIIADRTIGAIRHAMYGHAIHREHVAISPEMLAREHAGMLDDPEIEKIDTEHWNELIAKYAPICYLASNEIYMPIGVEEYCTGNKTSLIDATTGETIIPEGHVTMDEIYHLHQIADQTQGHKTYFQNEHAVMFGTDPALNTDKNNILHAPVYAVVYQSGSSLFIQYMFFYGFNGPYIVHKTQRVNDIFDAHEADLEHFTIELDSASLQPLRYYYSSHGTCQGFWLPAPNPDIAHDGTHPIVYIARSAHGTYPKSGTYVRIYGFANDETDKGMRWEPMIRRIYTENDPRFNVTTMGWAYHYGAYGKRGVGAAYDQGWFMNVIGGDIGRPYNSSDYCPPTNALAHAWCVLKYLPYAPIPQ